jgi:hypothetical protein
LRKIAIDRYEQREPKPSQIGDAVIVPQDDSVTPDELIDAASLETKLSPEEMDEEQRRRVSAIARLRAERTTESLPNHAEACEELSRLTQAVVEAPLQIYDHLTVLFTLLKVFERRRRAAEKKHDLGAEDAALSRIATVKRLIESWNTNRPVELNGQLARRRKPRYADQDDAIVEAIRSLGLDPLAPPAKEKRGKAGLKSKIKRIVIEDLTLFTDASFEHAWKRYRRSLQSAQR